MSVAQHIVAARDSDEEDLSYVDEFEGGVVETVAQPDERRRSWLL